VACPTSPEKAIVVVPLASGDPGAAQSPA